MKPILNKKDYRLIVWIIVIVLFAVGAAAALEKKPKIVFKETSWNIGRMKQGDVVSREFVFTNEGDAVLTIKNVDTSCGCAAAVVSEKTIQPGKSGKIKIAFNSRSTQGKVQKTVTVESDDPAASRVYLNISAEIFTTPQPKIEIDRVTYDAGLLLQDENIRATTIVQNKGEADLKFDCSSMFAEFKVDGQTAKFPVTLAPGKSAAVETILKRPGYQGNFKDFVLINSNDPNLATINMTVNAYVITKAQIKELVQKYKDILK